MRTLMKVTMPVGPANRAARSGELEKTLKSVVDALKAEASYFYSENGRRTALFVFELSDPSQIPVIAEPLFLGLEAEVVFWPVMNASDLRAGLTKAQTGARVPAAVL